MLFSFQRAWLEGQIFIFRLFSAADFQFTIRNSVVKKKFNKFLFFSFQPRVYFPTGPIDNPLAVICQVKTENYFLSLHKYRNRPDYLNETFPAQAFYVLILMILCNGSRKSERNKLLIVLRLRNVLDFLLIWMILKIQTRLLQRLRQHLCKLYRMGS